MATETPLPIGIQYDWVLVLQQAPKGYVEFRSQDGSEVFHGPIKNITIDDMDYVVINLKWYIKMPLTEGGVPNGKWEVCENKPLSFPNILVPYCFEQTTEKGPRIRFGLNLIYINKVEGIDPSTVEGLVVPDEENEG